MPVPHSSSSFCSLALSWSHSTALTLGGASGSGRTQAGGFGLGPGPSEVGSEFWRTTAPRAPGVAVGVGTAGSGSWEAGKAARFRVGWSCRDWDRGTGAAYGFSGTRCATRLCRERPGRVGCPLCGASPPGSGGPGLGGRGEESLWLPTVRRRRGALEVPEQVGQDQTHAATDKWPSLPPYPEIHDPCSGCACACTWLCRGCAERDSPVRALTWERGEAHLVRSLLGLHRPLHRRSLGKGPRGPGGGLGEWGLRPCAAGLGLGQGGVLLLVHPRSLLDLWRGRMPDGPALLRRLQNTAPPHRTALALWPVPSSTSPRPPPRSGGEASGSTSRAQAGLSAGLTPRP